MISQQTRNNKKLLVFSLLLFVFSSLSLDASSNVSETAKQLNNTAYEYLKRGSYKKAYELSLKAKQQATVENNDIELARSISNQASNLFYLGENEQALSHYNESLKIAKEVDDFDGIERAMSNIAAVYEQLKNLPETIKYRHDLYERSLARGTTKHKLMALISLSQTYLKLKNITQAEHYHALASEMYAKEENAFLRIYLLFSKAGIYRLNHRYENAIITLRTALKVARENKFNGLIASTRDNIAEIYFENKDFIKAEKESQIALELAIELQLKAKELESYQLLSQIYEAKKDYKSSLEHAKKAQKIEAKLSGEKIKQLAEITKIDRQFAETEEKLRQSQQLRKIAELKLASQKQMQIFWGVILISSAILVFFWFYRKASQRELIRQKQVNQELKELDKLKDRILTNTSHELRTPLNGIIGLSDIILLEYEGKIDQELQKSIQLIGKSGLQLSEIVDDILDFARLKAGRMPFNYGRFNIAILIREVISLCQPMVKTDKTQIIFHCPKCEIEVLQDRKRIQQVLFNLIGNAVKFTPEGTVQINCKKKEDFLWIDIKDTGIGIPENKIRRVFEGFEQVDPNDNRKHAGSGLGLAICRELSTALGGEIKMQSVVAEGTLVEFGFPLTLGHNQ